MCDSESGTLSESESVVRVTVLRVRLAARARSGIDAAAAVLRAPIMIIESPRHPSHPGDSWQLMLSPATGRPRQSGPPAGYY